MSGLDLQLTGTVVGDAEIKRKFLELDRDTRKSMRATLREIGEELRAAAASMAPRKTGALAGSIRARLSETNLPPRMVETVSIAASEKHIGRFMEFGTVNHGTRSNRALKGGRLAKVTRVRELRAAGTYRIKPRPFMGPALDGMRDRINAMLVAALGEAVDKANS